MNPPPKPLPAIPPVDPLSSSDDSSSDDYPAPTPRPHTTMLSYATIVHSNVTQPPQMTDGTITPGVIQEFKQCTKCFFLNAKGGITEQQKVIRLLGCFANPLVRDWIAMKHATLGALTFTKFMEAFRKCWLPSNWEDTTKSKILSSRLEPNKENFETWVLRMQKLNVALRGTTSYMEDKALRTHLASNLDEEFKYKMDRADPCKDEDLTKWIEAIATVDRERQYDRKRLNDHLDNFLRTHKRPYLAPHSTPSSDTTSTQGSSSSASSSPYPPRLTEEERRLLQEHEGCFKCRTFYAGHHQASCTTTISGKGYKTLTAQDALRAKAQKNSRRSTTMGVVSDAAQVERPASPDIVAALFPELGEDNDFSFTESADNSLSSVSPPPPLKCRHLIWHCMLTSRTDSFPVNALIDSGAHMVLIRSSLAHSLDLPIRTLPTPENVNVAISNNNPPHSLTHYIVLNPVSQHNTFVSKSVHAILANELSVPLILGLPFLVANNISCNYAKHKCNVVVNNQPVNILSKRKRHTIKTVPSDLLASLLQNACLPAAEHTLLEQETELRNKFKRVFEPLPHVNELPTEPLAQIWLKDPNSSIKTRNYPCPRKWKEAWHTLLQQHLEAGRIRPSEAPAGSGAFIILKADASVLPRWVNDYRQLNANTVTDCFPLPCISEILSDCRTGKFFASLDMTNSFFQTCMHPDDIKLTAVNTPCGLYEWVVMPMGIKNAPLIHQRRVTSALRPFIGCICHVYLDDIVIWSQTIDEHVVNVTMILNALQNHKLYCNPKKTKLFCT